MRLSSKKDAEILEHAIRENRKLKSQFSAPYLSFEASEILY